MTTGETPVMSSGSYGLRTSAINLAEADWNYTSTPLPAENKIVAENEYWDNLNQQKPKAARRVSPGIGATETDLTMFQHREDFNPLTGGEIKAQLKAAAMTQQKEDLNMRIVRVFLVDPDKRIEDLNKRLLYKSDELITDMTDQDLFFDIDVKSILEKHNKYRETVIYEVTSKGDTVEKTGLKPVRVSDLAMSVILVAEF